MQQDGMCLWVAIATKLQRTVKDCRDKWKAITGNRISGINTGTTQTASAATAAHYGVVNVWSDEEVLHVSLTFIIVSR